MVLIGDSANCRAHRKVTLTFTTDATDEELKKHLWKALKRLSSVGSASLARGYLDNDEQVIIKQEAGV